MKSAANYALAVFSVAVAVAITATFAELLTPMRLFFFWCAVLITAVAGGTTAGLLAALLSLVCTQFLYPASSTHDVVRYLLFGLFASGISAAVGNRRRAQERARASEQRAAFINRASERLSATLGSEETLRTLANLCVPTLGDWCAIDLGSGAGYRREVVEHTDPMLIHAMLDLDARYRANPDGDPIVQAMQTGRTQRIGDATVTPRVALITAPMIARGRTLGTLTVVRSRAHAAEDVPLVEELARRAATALDNARLYETAEQANRAKDDFLATLSHELRTPLTAISGWAHMLDLGIADEETRKLAVQTILRSARMQGELIDELLDVSGVVAGTTTLEMGAVDLSKVAAESVDAARPAIDGKGITIELDASVPLLVRGDVRRLRQVVWNLLTNAIKFTDGGGKIRVHATALDSSARVQITDNGRGIDPSFVPHVWERFRQADSSTSREHGGLGLGLAVVRHFVEMHGGTVHVESAGSLRGSTFTFTIPLMRAGSNVTPSVVEGAGGDLRGRRILLVDDDPATRQVLTKMLETFGAAVMSATGAAEARRLLEHGSFDAVLSDIAMPGEDGYSLASGTDVPMIAVSAMSTGEDDRSRALSAGFLDFVRKPVDPSELVRAISGVLRA
jgi:signal transduction histidine kinase/CheY-like chemotaxis protein